MDLEVEIARTAAAWRSLALTREPQPLPGSYASRNGDLHGVSSQLDGAIGAALRPLQLERARASLKGLFEVDVDARVTVAPGAATRARTWALGKPSLREPSARPAEQR